MKSAAQRPPRFFWQGVLILLPVAVLAGAGFISLRQDRVLAQHEAREKAQAIADEAADILWKKLTDPASVAEFGQHTFRLNAAGQVVFPPPAATLPIPNPTRIAALDALLRDDWNLAQSSATNAAQQATSIEACRRLVDAQPPEPFLARTQFRLEQLLASTENSDDAGRTFRYLLEDSPDARGESGLPLGVLAELQLLKLSFRPPNRSDAAPGAALWVFCSNVVSRPSFLTPLLIDRAAEIESKTGKTNITSAWREEWANQEFLRGLANAALAGHLETKVPELFWFEAADDSIHSQPLLPPPRTVVGSSKPYSRNTLSTFGISGQMTKGQSSPPDLRRQRQFSESFPVRWLAARVEDETNGGCWIVCRAMELIASGTSSSIPASLAWITLHESLPTLPEWFDVSVEVAGDTIMSGVDERDRMYLPAGKGGRRIRSPGLYVWTPEPLASARRGTAPEAALRVNIHLVRADALFARQRTRTRIFGTLIVVAVAATFVGFVSARRSFLRQQQLSEMKSNFVSSMSHELRAPIASVRLMAESLDRGKIVEPAKQREYFRFIVQECRRLGTLIENVLDFSRIEQGRKQYEFEPVDVAALVQQTVKLMEPAAAERDVILNARLPDPLPSHLTPHPSLDASAIQQALVNLIDNALKHSPPQSTVTVALEFMPQQSNLILSVADGGPGIPPEEQEKIFERFYRLGSELRRETPGVGIGLSIVKHIVEAHGGRVRVESEVGKGSRFILELPLRDAPGFPLANPKS